MSDTTAFLIALQYGDSAYPAGAFANSWGLETAVAAGDVTDRDSLAGACRSLLRHQTGPTDAVAAAACSVSATRHDLESFTEIDRRLSATRAAREPRDASARIGRRMLDTAASAEQHPWLQSLRDRVRAGNTPGNQACVLGAIAGLAGNTPEQAAALALWTAASGFLGAGLRLLRISHDDVQSILVELRPLMQRFAIEAVEADPLAMAGAAPQLEIWAMRHETATVRLFSS
ncbi:MAG: urease accessory protein UreF [Dehalococcoidia bacterium]